MPAHAVPGDTRAVIERVVRGEVGGQFCRDVVVHVVVLRPRGLRGVEVEARALAKVVGGVVGDALAARRGVGHDEGEAVLGGVALRPGFLGEVFVGAGEAGEPVEQRHAPTRQRLRRQIGRVGHLAVVGGRRVADAQLQAVKAFVFAQDVHGGLSSG